MKLRQCVPLKWFIDPHFATSGNKTPATIPLIPLIRPLWACTNDITYAPPHLYIYICTQQTLFDRISRPPSRFSFALKFMRCRRRSVGRPPLNKLVFARLVLCTLCAPVRWIWDSWWWGSFWCAHKTGICAAISWLKGRAAKTHTHKTHYPLEQPKRPRGPREHTLRLQHLTLAPRSCLPSSIVAIAAQSAESTHSAACVFLSNNTHTHHAATAKSSSFTSSDDNDDDDDCGVCDRCNDYVCFAAKAGSLPG